MESKEIVRGFLRSFGQYFISCTATLICKTLRVSYVNQQQVIELEGLKRNYVFAFWHGSMLLGWYLNRKKAFAALTSKSKDGDLLARVLKYWKYTVVRGSSSDGGDIALGIMIDYAKNNYSIAITPDGPKGPIYKFKAGAVITAKKSGIPLVLAAIDYKHYFQLNSWDKFKIPVPFSEAVVVFSDVMYIAKNLSYEETSEIINNCEKEMEKLQIKAREILNKN